MTELQELVKIRKILKRLLIYFEDKQDADYQRRRKTELTGTD